MAWCGVAGHGRAEQFLSRFHFAVNSTRPQMGLNSCRRDPEVLVQVDLVLLGYWCVWTRGSVNQFSINLSSIPTGSYEFFFNVVCNC